ncbi:UNKNOWN [Stylonychia lemnae]|uniref:Uncharacterized protein n=1 Tax=Stylonychia lemnae TaxID=5949 RepID=A0A078AFS0_STYLE|nr:UNKNOWN [Stylonychia lemnae]|eukprot:CDW81100.1 UNKNOWN [Stylonychia lemnae]
MEEFKNVDQQKLFNRKQVIKVNGFDIEFSQNDYLFQIKKTQIDVTQSQQKIFGDYLGKNCFSCQKQMVKKSNMRQCDFCAKIGQGIQNQQLIIKQTMYDIFKGLQDREIYQERLQKDIFSQQDQHNQNRFEIEQIKIQQRNMENKQERLQKYEKLNTNLSKKMELKKNEVIEKQIIIRNLMEEVEDLRFDLDKMQEELQVKAGDEQYMRDYFRKLNPIQPKQGSFNKNPTKKHTSLERSITEPSLTFSQLEQQQDQQNIYQDTGMNHLEAVSSANRLNSTGTNSINSRRKKLNNMPTNKPCCDGGCIIA